MYEYVQEVHSREGAVLPPAAAQQVTHRPGPRLANLHALHSPTQLGTSFTVQILTQATNGQLVPMLSQYATCVTTSSTTMLLCA
jgi:hypothetical protein